MMSKLFLFFVVAATLAVVRASDTSFMKPRDGATGATVAVIFAQGAQIPYASYMPMLETLQNSTNLKLWIGFPGFTADLPNPLQIGSSVKNAIEMMTSAGMGPAPIFYAGHSLGTVMMQDYLVNNTVADAAGLVLMGGFLQRKYFWPQFNYPTPTLTIGGELDGLSRITRIIESHYIQADKYALDYKKFPVAYLPGCNHFNFAGTGKIPFLVADRDLMAETPAVDSWAAIAALFTDFILTSMGQSNGNTLATYVADMKTFAAPVIDAYIQEGSRHFNAPIQVSGPLASKCVRGGCQDNSAWAPNAQLNIGAGIAGFSVEATNEYVDLSAEPLINEDFHLPNITVEGGGKIKVTTYTQGAWDALDELDTGFSPNSAEELGTKLASRQCILIHGAGMPNSTVNFNITDAPDFCKMTNMQAYDYAVSRAGSATGARFSKYGQVFTFGADEQKSGGPWWIDARIDYTSVTQPDGTKVIQVSSPAARTPIDEWQKIFGPIPRPSWIPDPGCFHYCKLLSPARAMEWIYVDSMRLNRSIKPNKV